MLGKIKLTFQLVPDPLSFTFSGNFSISKAIKLKLICRNEIWEIGTNSEWQKIIYNQTLDESWDRTDFTTLKLPLATKTWSSLTILGGKVGDSKFATRFTSIRLMKQRDFCVAIVLMYFIGNCLDLL